VTCLCGVAGAIDFAALFHMKLVEINESVMTKTSRTELIIRCMTGIHLS